MANIKLVLTDLDGTVVLPSQNEVSQIVRSAVIEVESRGVEVVPVTGRPLWMAQPAMGALGFDDLCVVDGGATIAKIHSGEIVWSLWLEPIVLRELIEIMAPYAVEMIEYSPTQALTLPADVNLDDITDAAPYTFCPVPNGVVDELEAKLAMIPHVVSHSNPCWAGKENLTGIQVTHKLADKYHGVQKLLELTGINEDQVLAIGDSNNDLPLFESATIKVAMGNATERLKSQADYVVASVENDGFAEAMRRFVL